MEIEVVDHSLGVVAGNIHLAGQLKDPAVAFAAFGNDTGIHTAAAPVFELGGRIAGDGGVADLHGAGCADAAAAFGGVILNGGILDDSGDIGVTCGSLALGSGNIYAAAQALPTVIAGNGGTVNGEGAVPHAYPAAAMRSGVVGDVGFANGEGAALRVDSTAVGGLVAGDGAAVDGDSAPLGVHGTAVDSRTLGNGAAVHGEGAAFDIYGTAVAAAGPGGDRAAVHDEGAAIDPHTAAVGCAAGVAGPVSPKAGELAVPQGEGGAGAHFHATGVVGAIIDAGDLA